jgi:hypothetical protein
MFHDVLGHSGISQTLTILHQHFHWPGVKRDVTLFISSCEACQKVKAVPPPPLPIQRPVLFEPMEHVHIDLFGPYKDLSKRKRGEKELDKVYVMLCIDYFTKVAEMTPIDDKLPTTTAHAFYNSWICRYGTPAVVTTDNGPEFLGEFVHMLSRLGINTYRPLPTTYLLMALWRDLFKLSKIC